MICTFDGVALFVTEHRVFCSVSPNSSRLLPTSSKLPSFSGYLTRLWEGYGSAASQKTDPGKWIEIGTRSSGPNRKRVNQPRQRIGKVVTHQLAHLRDRGISRTVPFSKWEHLPPWLGHALGLTCSLLYVFIRERNSLSVFVAPLAGRPSMRSTEWLMGPIWRWEEWTVESQTKK